MTNAAALAADPSAIQIRQLETISEMDACVRLQQSVWQFPDFEIIPRRMFLVARAIGGHVLGAWDNHKLAAFALAIPGWRDGQPFLHSQMLAVCPEYRNRGIAVRLKLAQREDALARGIDRIEWTFDPMQAKNAYLNIEKLGAIVRRYSIDFYGKSTSPLHNGLPTDRLHAEWWLRSQRVKLLLEGRKLPRCIVKDIVTVTYRRNNHGGTLQPTPDAASNALLKVRDQFVRAFAHGLTVLNFEIVSDTEARYLLGTDDGEGSAKDCGEDSERRRIQ
jgi:predicted GNAT superfamily acetyltransferase